METRTGTNGDRLGHKQRIALRVLGALFLLLGAAGCYLWFYHWGPLRRTWNPDWLERHSALAAWQETELRIHRSGWAHDDFSMVGHYGDKEWTVWILDKAIAGERISDCESGHKDAALETLTNQEPEDKGDPTTEQRWMEWWSQNKNKTQEEWIRDGFAQQGLMLEDPLTTNNIHALLSLIGNTNRLQNTPGDVRYNAMRWLRDSEMVAGTFTLQQLPATNAEGIFRGMIRYANFIGATPRSEGLGVLLLRPPPLNDRFDRSFPSQYEGKVRLSLALFFGFGVLCMGLASWNGKRKTAHPPPTPRGRSRSIKRSLAALGILLLLWGLAFTAYQFWITRSPVWQEKPVRQWVSEIEFSGFTYHCDPAVDALNQMDADELIPVLVRILKSPPLPDWFTGHPSDDDEFDLDSAASKAAFMLGEMGLEARGTIEDLVHALQSKDASLRRQAAEALGKINQQPEICIPALMDRLEDPSQPVRLYAIEAIGEFGLMAHPYYDRWKIALDDEDDSVVRVAMRSMRAAGIDQEEFQNQLRRQLASPDTWIQESAAGHLGKLGREAKESIPWLRPLLNSKDEDVRFVALTSMLQIDPALAEEIEQHLLEFKQEQGDEIQMRAVVVLHSIDPDQYPVLPRLYANASSTSVYARISAAESILEIDPGWASNAIPILTGALKLDDACAQCRAMDVLQQIGPSAQLAVPALEALLQHEDTDVSGTAAKTLRAITGP